MLFRSQIDYFKGWLYQVAKNHCLMKLRKSKHYTIQIDGEFVQFADHSHLDDVFAKEQQLHLMEKCLEQLTDQQKKAVSMFYLEQKCYKEISQLVEIEINMVKSHIQNGRRNLKNCMEKNSTEIA